MINDQEPILHSSDCSTNNEPAMPAGECDCEASGAVVERPLAETNVVPEPILNELYGMPVIRTGSVLDDRPFSEQVAKTGPFHPAQVLLDQIDIASSFPDPGAGQRIRELVRQARKLL